MNNVICSLGGRRFLMSLLFGLIASYFVWHSKISDEVYGLLIGGLVVSYITGNTIQKSNEAKNESSSGS
jgi:hypothetical protein